MKLSRKVCIGFRNIGAAADPGEFYEGSLADAIKWMIEKCQAQTIAKRFSIAIARNKDECMVQFESSSRGIVAESSMAGIMAMLDNLDDDDDSQSERRQDSVAAPASELDTYKD